MLRRCTRVWLRRAVSTTSAATRHGHPLVDVAALRQPAGDPARSAAVASLRSAIFDRGYFYAANVAELPEAYLAGIYAYSRRVHALSPAVKRKYAQRGGTGSYSGCARISF